MILRLLVALALCQGPTIPMGNTGNISRPGITAGDMIICEGKWNTLTSLTSVTDTLNSATASTSRGSFTDTTLNISFNYFFFFGGSLAGNSDTITMTIGAAETNNTLACQAWKNAFTGTNGVDTGTGNLTGTATTSANATSSTWTTANNGDLIFSVLNTTSVVPTASSGTLVDAATSTNFYPQYWYQSTASASTTTSYTNSSNYWEMGWLAYRNNSSPSLDGACHAVNVNTSSSTTVSVTISC